MAFHATCAQQANLCMGSWKDDDTDEWVMQTYCDQHTPKWYDEKPYVSTHKGEVIKDEKAMKDMTFLQLNFID